MEESKSLQWWYNLSLPARLLMVGLAAPILVLNFWAVSSILHYFGVLVAVRALYLDLAQWALEDPGRWGPWVAPCPISGNEIDRRKEKRHRKSRMDTRTRERLPVLLPKVPVPGDARCELVHA